MTPPPDYTPPDRAALLEIFRMKYGEPGSTGWGPAMRLRFDYFTPDDVYEGAVERLVTDGCAWLDVGCGRDLFPFNKQLSRVLADRAGLLVGVDPAPTLAENEFVHEAVHCTIDEFETEHSFDLVTLRMVAEHVEYPERVVNALANCTLPGSRVLIYTVNRFSPVPLMTSLVPFALHQPIKRVLWRTEAKDTFPTCFRMNTRSRLAEQLAAGGFEEVAFDYLDDCRTTARFRPLLWMELSLRRLLRAVGLRYPESCLLGLYRRA